MLKSPNFFQFQFEIEINSADGHNFLLGLGDSDKLFGSLKTSNLGNVMNWKFNSIQFFSYN